MGDPEPAEGAGRETYPEPEAYPEPAEGAGPEDPDPGLEEPEPAEGAGPGDPDPGLEEPDPGVEEPDPGISGEGSSLGPAGYSVAEGVEPSVSVSRLTKRGVPSQQKVPCIPCPNTVCSFLLLFLPSPPGVIPTYQ